MTKDIFNHNARFLLLALTFLSLHFVSAKTYYLRVAGGDIATTANWGINTDGSGTSPASFDKGDIFVIPSGVSGTLASTWIFGNSGRTVAQSLEVNGTLTINSNGLLELNQTTTGTTDVVVLSGGIIECASTSIAIAGIGTQTNNNLTFQSGSTLRTVNANGIMGLTVNAASIDNTNLTTTFNSGTVNFEFYLNGNQSLTNLPSSIGNLTLSAGGIKSGLPASTAIAGNLTCSGSTTFTLSNPLTVSGNIEIQTSATLNSGNNSVNISGNWTNSGTLTSTGIINFNGTGTQSINSGIFNSLTISNSTGTVSLGGNISITGNFTNNGTFSGGSSTVSFTGSSAQLLAGSNATTFYNLTQNGTGGTTLGSQNITVSNLLTLTSGNITLDTYTLQTENLNTGSSSSYIKTNSTGRLKMAVLQGNTYTFPVGNSSYNPIYGGVNGTGQSASDYYSIRVEDGALTNVNAANQTVNRKWYVMGTNPGLHNISANVTYNSGDENNGALSGTRQVAYFNGTAWGYANGTASGTGPYVISASGFQTELTSSSGYIAVGQDLAFAPSKFALTVMPPNPTVNANSTIIKVDAVNASGTYVYLHDNITFSITSTNGITRVNNLGETLLLTGLTLTANTYTTNVDFVKFTTSTYNSSDNTTYTTASVTTTQTAGTTSISTTTSSLFAIFEGSMFRPYSTTGNLSTMQWQKSTNGGTTWTDASGDGSYTAADQKLVFGSSEIALIPATYSINLDTDLSIYSLIVYGSATLSSGTITMNHTSGTHNDYDIEVHGDFTQTGGTINNTNTSYPIRVHGGTFIYSVNGGSLPNMAFESMAGTKAKCIINGLSSNQLSGGLNLMFQDLEWNNTVDQTLSEDLSVSGVFTLKSGIITTGVNKFHLHSTGSINRTGGYINGNLQYHIPGGTNNSYSFPIGDAYGYSPISITFDGTVVDGGNFYIYTKRFTPNIGSTIDSNNRINREWDIVNSGVTGYTSYTANLTYLDSDIAGTLSSPVMSIFNGGLWKIKTNPTLVSNTYSVSGLIEFGEFFVGNSLSTATNNIWLGTTTDWNTDTNWSNGSVPGSSVNVTLPTGLTKYPNLSGNGSCNHLSLESGSTVTTNAYTLSVSGNISNSGTITGTGGTISLTGNSTAQGLSGSGSFNLNNFTITNTYGATSASNITVEGALTINVPNPSATQGVLAMDSVNTKLLYMGANSSTVGQGDVTGFVMRNHAFSSNIEYTIGNALSSFTFKGVGTKPQWIRTCISIGYKPHTLTGVKRFYKFMRDASTPTDLMNFKFHYLDSEINGNTETLLSYFDSHKTTTPYVIHEHGFTGRDENNNWVTLTNSEASYFPTTTGNKMIYLATAVLTRNTWQGVLGTSTNWTTSSNWSSGHYPGASGYLSDNAYIPAGTSVLPSLDVDITLNSLEIANGASLAANTKNITVSGNGIAWKCEGTFEPGTGTVTFTDDYTSSSKFVELHGTTDLNNLVLGTNTHAQLYRDSKLTIGGTFTKNTGADIDLNTYSTTEGGGASTSIEFNPTTSITIPDMDASNGYDHLIINNSSGTVTLPASIKVRGNFTNNGNVNASNTTVNFTGTIRTQQIGGLNPITFKHVNIGANSTVRFPSTITITGDLVNDGTLDASTNSSNITLNGLAAQSISGSAASTTLSTLTVNNSAGVTVNSNITASTISNATGSTLNVAAGKGLSSTTISNSGTIHLKSDNTGTATLISNQSSLNIKAQQFMSYGATSPSKYFRYWYVSSPISAATSSVFNINTAGTEVDPRYYAYKYSESTGNYTAMSNEALVPGTGYAVQFATDRTPSFTGVANTGTILVTLSKTDANTTSGGWNLIGNPYPAFVNWQTLYATRSSDAINPSIVYRTINETTNGMSYIYYNAISNTSLPVDAQNMNIPPMQAFWTYTTTNGATLSFENNQKTHQTQSNTSLRMRTPAENSDGRIVLKVEKDGFSDQAFIGEFASALNSFDNYDTPKIMNDGNTPSLFSTIDGKALAINGMSDIDENTSITLGFQTAKAGDFSITLPKSENLNSLPVYLTDNQTGNQILLTQEGNYSFYSEPIVDFSRFTLSFSSKVVTEMNNEILPSNKIYYSDGYLFVELDQVIQSNIRIYGLNGVLVYSGNLSEKKNKIALPLIHGIYPLEIRNSKYCAKSKLII